jgi:hypothetical protein
MPGGWIPKNSNEVCKRAAGRRRFQARRQRIRDERQLLIMEILVKANWPRYGIGRALARAFSVNPSTISRDLKSIRAWRASLIREGNLSQKLADAIILRLVDSGLHPRLGYSWRSQYAHGVTSLTVGRGRIYA